MLSRLKPIRCSFTMLMLTFPVASIANEILDEPPEVPDPGARYVFYLHGQIVEDEGLRPTHPRYGLYDYPLILDTLAGHGLTVISERRKPGTDREKYARNLVNQVENMLGAGIEPGRITVLGFSAGGIIALQVSSMMRDTNINFVIMASCADWIHDAPSLRLNGRVLSVHEQSDFAYSCKELAERNPAPAEFHSVEINTGKEHGAFYLPDDAWILPVVDWIAAAD